MGKRHSQAADKPLLLTPGLPQSEHVKTVQILAVATSMNTAFVCATGKCSCNQRGLARHLTGPGHLLHVTSTLIQIYGTDPTILAVNDRPRFQAIFIRIVPRVYPSFLAFLQRSPGRLAILADFSDHDRLAALNTAATQQLHLLDLPPGEPLPITWPAPIIMKQEVV